MIRTVPALIDYYHVTLGAPPIVTWLEAINKGWFQSWPGLTAARVRKYCSAKPQTSYGHMRLIKQHVQSTKPTQPNDNNKQPDEPKERSKNHDVEVYLIDDMENYIAMDTCGRYPITSARGHKYIFVLLDRDTNRVYLRTMKSRKSHALIEAYADCYQQLLAAGFTAKLVRLDNEISEDLVAAIKHDKLKYQLASPSDHRQNPAERAIQDVKAHFISVRSCADTDFDPKDWDLLIPHVEHTLNLLRPSKINPRISAYTMVDGHYDYLKNPIAPVGCKVVVHERPMNRGSWSDRGTDGFFLRMAPNHYRNFTCYIPSTKGIRTSNTVEFFPTCCAVPKVEPIDHVTLILQELKELITNNAKTDLFYGSTATLALALKELQQALGIANASHGDNTSKGAPIQPSRHTYKGAATTITIFPTGTIIRKAFDGEWYKGEITSYNTTTQFYHIKYTDGDAEDMTYEEVKQLRKPSQRYSGKSQQMLLNFARGDNNHAKALALQRYYQTLAKQHKCRSKARKVKAIRLRALQTKARKGMALATELQHLALKAGCIWDNELKKWMDLEGLLAHPNPTIRERWQRSSTKEYGNIFQGSEFSEGKNVCHWIRKEDIPKGKQITYPRTVVDYRPEKDDPNRTRITAGGDKLEYEGETAVNSADYTTIKCHWNSVLSSPGYKYATMDAGNMYLETDLPRSRYVHFKLKQIPISIQQRYSLQDYVDRQGYVYARIDKAWYGLKESGKLAGDDIRAHLAEYGYHESKYTAGLFKHESRPISFTLVVDDFGVKYKKLSDFEHLRDCLSLRYKMKVDMDAKQYVGIDLEWDYNKRTLLCSMNEYVDTALKEFEHAIPKQHYCAPSKSTRPDYGAKVQYVEDDQSRSLNLNEIKRIQKITGKFLFLARAVDNTILHALNELACDVTKGTANTLAAANHLLNYIASNPNPTICYQASDMILHTDSDAAFHVRPQARNRAGGYHYLGSRQGDLFNAPVLVLAKVIKNVMGSAAEAEVAAIHMNAHEAIPIRQCLAELGHSQPATRIRTDNATAKGFINGTIKQKRSRTFDRQYWWLKDREAQMQFHIVWDPGIYNLADYSTKHHTAQHHKQVRPIYLHENTSPTHLQGCNEILTNNRQTKRIVATLKQYRGMLAAGAA